MIVGAIVDLTDIVNQIQQSLPPGLTVLYSSASAAFQIDTNVPGLFGNFSVLISGNPIAPSITPVDNTPLIAGRYVVPVIDNLDLGLEQFDSTPRYRYPIISDNSNLLYSGGFVIFDGHTNISLNSLINDNGLVTQATNFAVLKRGCIAVLPATALPSATAAIFMHTLNSGSNLAGSLTVTPSATTIPVTGGLLTILSGSNVAGRICEIQKLDY